MAVRKPNTSNKLPELSAFTRSRVSNQLGALHGVDGRSMIARRYKELCLDLAHHLGGDPTSTQLALLRRCAALQAWCEQAEASFAETGDLDMPTFSSATNTLRRLTADLGMKRAGKDVTDLREYISGKAS